MQKSERVASFLFPLVSFTVSVHKNNKIGLSTDAGSKLRNISHLVKSPGFFRGIFSFFQAWKINWAEEQTSQKTRSEVAALQFTQSTYATFHSQLQDFFGFAIIVSVCLLYLEKVTCLLLGVWGLLFAYLGWSVFAFFHFFFFIIKQVFPLQSQFFEKIHFYAKCLSSTLDIQKKNSVKCPKPLTCPKNPHFCLWGLVLGITPSYLS